MQSLPFRDQSKPETSRKTCKIRTFLPRPLQAAINPSAASQTDSPQPPRPQSGSKSCALFLGQSISTPLSHQEAAGGTNTPGWADWCHRDHQLPDCHVYKNKTASFLETGKAEGAGELLDAAPTHPNPPHPTPVQLSTTTAGSAAPAKGQQGQDTAPGTHLCRAWG